MIIQMTSVSPLLQLKQNSCISIVQYFCYETSCTSVVQLFQFSCNDGLTATVLRCWAQRFALLLKPHPVSELDRLGGEDGVSIQFVDVLATLSAEPGIRRQAEDVAVAPSAAVLTAEHIARHDERLLVVAVRARVEVRVVILDFRFVLVDDRLVEVESRDGRVQRTFALDAQFQRFVVDLDTFSVRQLTVHIRLLVAYNYCLIHGVCVWRGVLPQLIPNSVPEQPTE
jgi:hypothetical protein